MKKNISINIGGIIFHIDEDGFDQLKNYLDSVNTYFASFEDSKEIVEDIEGRIAELFLAKLDEGKQIITKVDVTDLIATMGTTKDFAETVEPEPEASQSEQEEAQDESSQQREDQQEPAKEDGSFERTKRLFRDTKRKVLGGVASGFANYFGIDPIWIRLLMLALLLNIFFWGLSTAVFVVYIVLWIAIPGHDQLDEDKGVKKLFRNGDDKVLGGVSSGIASYFGIDPLAMRVIFVVTIFLGGAGFLAYIVLWIITPEAKTITEKMQMQGEPVTLSNIEDNVKKSFSGKEGKENALVKILLFPFRLIALIFKALGEFLGPLLRFLVESLRILVGVFILFFGATSIISLTIALAAVLGVGGTIENWVQFGDFPAIELFSTLSGFAIAFAYFTAVVPMLLLVLSGISIIMKRWATKAYVGWSLLGIWLIGMIGSAITIPQVVRNFTAEGSFKEERTFAIEAATPILTLKELDISGYESVTLKLRGHKDSTKYKLKLDFESRGNSKTNARSNAEAVEYGVTRANGDFYFESGLSFGDAPFRFQDVDATFYIPNGKVFRMDESLGDILRNSLWMYDYTEDDMENNDWVFRADGSLHCLTCEKKKDTSASKRFQKGRTAKPDQYGYEDFDEIVLVSMMDFEIVKSERFSLQIDGDEEDLEEIYVKQTGDELEIRYKKEWNWWKDASRKDRVKVLIELPRLEHLEISGACEGSVKGFNNSDISFDIVGASQVLADVSPEYLGADVTGASSLTLEGKAKEMEIDLTGASRLDAFNFEAVDVDVSAIGASTAKVYASEELNAVAAGASSIRYRGSANVTSDSNGFSSVKKD
ncbi:MAG: PspC domain-containing protein [Bacteroidota bacterium]